MCLAIPGKILSIDESMACCNFNGAKRQISIDLVPKATVGDYVLVHAGFAIEIINSEEADKTIKLLEEMK